MVDRDTEELALLIETVGAEIPAEPELRGDGVAAKGSVRSSWSGPLAATEVLYEQHKVGPVVGRNGVGHVRGEQHGVRRVDAELLGPRRHGAGAL